ncbi:MAG: TolC family protein [Bryobacteraceae bacterium]|jgi:outer membrane protein TolC
MLLFWGLSAGAVEVRTLTLREAIDLALNQNPDILLARLDQQKAEDAVRLARDPFIPKVVVGSGLAYSNGFPMSIEGATPSIMQARAIADVFNRPQSYRVAAAKESRRGAALDAGARQDEIVYRTAELFLEAQKGARMAGVAGAEVKSLEGVLETVRARVAEGRELPIESRKAELNLARARYRSQVLDGNTRAAQNALGVVLGLDAAELVRPVDTESPAPAMPESPDAAVKSALANSKELRALQSKLLAKGFDIRAQRAGRLPTFDLVAQYGLLAKFNNYADFFSKFQRHNGQLGISFQLPLFSGPGIAAASAQAEAEAAQLRIQFRSVRRRIESDTRRAYEDIQQAEAARDVAQLDLDVAREQVSLLLAQMQEGRAALRQVEEARAAETGKWIAFYDAGTNLEKARLNLLRHTGELQAALR